MPGSAAASTCLHRADSAAVGRCRAWVRTLRSRTLAPGPHRRRRSWPACSRTSQLPLSSSLPSSAEARLPLAAAVAVVRRPTAGDSRVLTGRLVAGPATRHGGPPTPRRARSQLLGMSWARSRSCCVGFPLDESFRTRLWRCSDCTEAARVVEWRRRVVRCPTRRWAAAFFSTALARLSHNIQHSFTAVGYICISFGFVYILQCLLCWVVITYLGLWNLSLGLCQIFGFCCFLEQEALLLQRDRATRCVSKFVLCFTRYGS